MKSRGGGDIEFSVGWASVAEEKIRKVVSPQATQQKRSSSLQTSQLLQWPLVLETRTNLGPSLHLFLSYSPPPIRRRALILHNLVSISQSNAHLPPFISLGTAATPKL